jgi:hypothetical protein
VTPLAWLIALRVGIMCVAHSRSIQARRRLQGAALAGACFGLLQGLLFWVIVPRMEPIQESEQTSAKIIVLMMVVIGLLVASALSTFTAYQIERRRNP